MAGSREAVLIIVFCGLFGLITCQNKASTKPGKPLPPLLPPVPSRQQTELLTRQQLSFIRHHQKKQQLDIVNYNPYLCVPKYLCIVDDEEGNKRTTIINGLHPVLREDSNLKYQDPGFGPAGPINVPKLSVKSDLRSAKDEKRAVDDEFLWDQEINEQAALEQQKRQQLFNHHETEKKESSEREESTESDSGESNEEGDDNRSADDGSPENYREQPKPLNFQNNERPPGPSSKDSVKSFEDLLKEVDHMTDAIVTVPWDDRPKNKTDDPTLSQMIKSALPSLPISFLSKRTGNARAPATTPQRSILRRMLGVRRNFFRAKRDVGQARNSAVPFMTKLGPGIKSSEQCRILYNGCDLNYDQVMSIATNGQVLIEGDEPKTTTAKPNEPNSFIKAEDDEADQAMRDVPNRPRPFGSPNKRPYQAPKQKPGFGFKVKGSKYGNSYSPFNQIKKKPRPPPGPLENDEVDSLSVPSLPILPMRFTWGRPNFYKGRPPYPNIFDDLDSRRPTQPPTPPPPSTPPPPVFAVNPIYKKVNRTGTTTNVVPINATHALEIIVPSSKPFRPMKAPVHDKNGRPSSFASVFTEIAGSSGGLHDFFEKIANTVGHQPNRRTQKQFSVATPVKQSTKLPSYRIKSKKKTKVVKIKEKEQDDESRSEEDEEDEGADEETSSKNDDDMEDEEADEDIVTKNDDQDQEDEIADDETKKDESNEEENEKKADEVELPEDMPEHIREAIREDIRTGGKKNKDGPDKPEESEGMSPGQEQGQGQGPPPGPGYNQQRPGTPPYNQQRPGPPPYNQQRPGPPPYNQQRPGPTPYNQQRPGPQQGYRPGPPPRRGMFPFF